MSLAQENLCRICLEEGAAESIFGTDHFPTYLMIMSCSSVQINENDGLPSMICNECLKNLNVAYNFKQQCETTDLQLKQFLSSVGRNSDDKTEKDIYVSQTDEEDETDTHSIQFEYDTNSVLKFSTQQPEYEQDADKNVEIYEVCEILNPSADNITLQTIVSQECNTDVYVPHQDFVSKDPDLIITAPDVTTDTRRNYEPDESSSNSDEIRKVALQERRKRKHCDYTCVIRGHTDQEFKSHFRMSKATFEFVLNILREDLTRNVSGCPTIPASQQLMIALWKMATMDSYRSVSERFNVGKATALRAVRRVSQALLKRAPTYIQWPTSDYAICVMRGFETSSGFPKTIGAIDGTHIHINAPKNSADYINRQGFNSIQLQLICDHRTLITHCYTGHPGSVHDQGVFRLSEVADYCNDDEKFPMDSHILGDTAYELHQHLLTPFQNNGHLTERQKNYNYRHSKARVTVERCIGLLKGRMRSLLHCLPMLRIDLMAEYIVACCVIHNICTLRGDEISVITIPTQLQDNVTNVNVSRQVRHTAGTCKRNLIMRNLQLQNL